MEQAENDEAKGKVSSRRLLKVIIEDIEERLNELVEQREMGFKAWKELTGKDWPDE